MIKKTFLFLLAAALASTAAFAQKPGDKPLTENDLLKQIEALTPSGGNLPSSRPTTAPPPNPLQESPVPAVEAPRPAEKKAKGPTEITALEAAFDQKSNIAIFIGSVVVADPEFNVTCDKLTAHLKREEKANPAATPTTGKATPKPDESGASKKKRGGGLERAVADAIGEQPVVITQDKKDAEGNVTHSVGKGRKATYDAVSGDIVLTGTPEVTQGINRVIATDPGTVITLNRDGHMKAVGPHKTIIVDKGDALDSK